MWAYLNGASSIVGRGDDFWKSWFLGAPPPDKSGGGLLIGLSIVNPSAPVLLMERRQIARATSHPEREPV